MKVLLTANHVPFIRGGAESHIGNLAHALHAAGHDVEVLRLPFRFSPDSAIDSAMAAARALDLSQPNGITIDRVISLQFPVWGLTHPDHRVWVMHQHRAVYDLYDEGNASPSTRDLRQRIQEFDKVALSRAGQIYANSKRVAERLAEHNGVRASPLYHPPPQADMYYCGEALPYIFMPGRMETLKRHKLLLDALALTRSGLYVLLAGTGGQEADVRQHIAALGLEHRVRLLGHISDAEMLACYARATAICCTAYDEDYGYVPLEAMCAGKAVLVCSDGGGLLEFIRHGENGWVEPAEPEAVAARLDWIASNRERVRQMGACAKKYWDAHAITWPGVVATLMQ